MIAAREKLAAQHVGCCTFTLCRSGMAGDGATGTPVRTVPLIGILTAIDEAIEGGRWPLVLDPTGAFATFMRYRTSFLLEVKRGFVASKLRKTKTVEAVREEWRKVEYLIHSRVFPTQCWWESSSI